MNESELQEIIEVAWRRPLTPEELADIQTWCSRHPERRAEIELDLQAARCLHGLRDVEVPSHFMSQVWRGIDRPESVSKRPKLAVVPGWSWRLWLPRFAVATLVVSGGFAGWQRYQTTQRTQVAAGFQQVAQAASIPDPGMLQEIDTLRLLMETPGSVDVELLAALQ